MPATRDEAEHIVSIALGYLPLGKLAQLFQRLNEEVGQKSDNDSLKQTLAGLSAVTLLRGREELRVASLLKTAAERSISEHNAYMDDKTKTYPEHIHTVISRLQRALEGKEDADVSAGS